MKALFLLGKASSIEDAVIGEVFRYGEHAGHELSSYRGNPMGLEVGDGCVLFRDPSEMEELYAHMDWVQALPYRESSIARIREACDSYDSGRPT